MPDIEYYLVSLLLKMNTVDQHRLPQYFYEPLRQQNPFRFHRVITMMNIITAIFLSMRYLLRSHVPRA